MTTGLHKKKKIEERETETGKKVFREDQNLRSQGDRRAYNRGLTAGSKKSNCVEGVIAFEHRGDRHSVLRTEVPRGLNSIGVDNSIAQSQKKKGGRTSKGGKNSPSRDPLSRKTSAWSTTGQEIDEPRVEGAVEKFLKARAASQAIAFGDES